MLLESYTEKIHFIPTLKTRLNTLQAEHENNMNIIKENHTKEIQNMKVNFEKLHADFLKVTEEANKKGDIIKNLESDLDRENVKFKDMLSINRNLIKIIKRNEEDIHNIQKDITLKEESNKLNEIYMNEKVSSHLLFFYIYTYSI